MKTLLLLSLLFTGAVRATPVLNQNAAAEGSTVQIWPDHQDSDHFYFAPSRIVLSSDAAGPKFHLTRFQTGCSVMGIGCKRKGMINALLVASFQDEALRKAQDGILRLRPQARFSAIPMLDGEVRFTAVLAPFIVAEDCSPRTGQATDEIPCNLTINNRGLSKLVPFLADGKVLAFQFVYRIQGVNALANGYVEAQTRYGVAVELGGEALKGHQDL